MDNWKTYKLSELGFLARGKSKHRPRDAAFLYGGEYPFIQTGDIKAANHRIKKYTQTYNEQGLKQSKLWDAGTICITIAANIADTAILDFPACFPDSVMGFVPDGNKCDTDFIEYLLQFYKRRIQTHSIGSVQDNINLGTFERVEFSIPPLAEQKAIARVLSALDDKIELNRRMNATLEAMARALFKAWFVDFEPVRANLKNRPSASASPAIAQLFPSEFDNGLPKGWKMKRISQCCDVARGSSPRPIHEYIGDDIPWVKIADATSARSFFIFETKEKIKASGKDKSVFLKKGSLILSNSATCGVPMFLEVDGCVHDGWLFFANYRGITPDYLFQALSRMSERLIHEADGTVQKNLNIALISKQEVLIPPSPIMSSFERVHTSLLNKIKGNIQQNQELTETRDALLPRLMAGKIRVGEVEKEVHAAG